MKQRGRERNREEREKQRGRERNREEREKQRGERETERRERETERRERNREERLKQRGEREKIQLLAVLIFQCFTRTQRNGKVLFTFPYYAMLYGER